MEDFIKGTIFKVESKDYYIFSDSSEEIRCSLRGKFQKEYSLKKDKLYAIDIAVVGDCVEYDLNNDGSGVITKIYPRKNHVSRKAPRIKGATIRGQRLEQIVAANLDYLIIVSSFDLPKFNNRLIDRLIVSAESSNVTPILIINKIDLDVNNEIEDWRKLYESIGYKVFLVSAKEKIGLENIHEVVKGKISLVWGHSGVGKSSILNAIYPSLKLKIGDISEFTSKGKHTTVTSLMCKVEDNSFIIDTPGIREIDPYGIKKEDLGHYFGEFAEFINECKFNTCTHHHEPDCAVIEAVGSGSISSERYASYLALLETVEEDLFFQ